MIGVKESRRRGFILSDRQQARLGSDRPDVIV